jgi:hypothetical protein
MTHTLKEACRQLRLSGLAGSLELRVQEATSHQLPHVQFLELLLQDESHRVGTQAQRQDTIDFAHVDGLAIRAGV